MSLSDSIENQFKYVDALTTTLESTSERLQGALERELGEKPSAKLLAATRETIKQVQARRESYRKALDGLSREEREDSGLRSRLNVVYRDLDAGARTVRNALLAGFGQGALDTYALSAAPPEARRKLAHYAETALSRLRDSPQSATTLYNTQVETAPLATLLGERLKAFNEVHDAYLLDEKETTNTRDQRDAMQEGFQRALVNTARILEGTLRLARLDYIADRIRPTSSRVRGEEAIEAEFDLDADPELLN